MNDKHDKIIFAIAIIGLVITEIVFIIKLCLSTSTKEIVLSSVGAIVSLSLGIAGAMIKISYEITKTYSVVQNEFRTYCEQIKKHNECNEILTKSIDSFTKTSEYLVQDLPCKLTNNTKNIIDGVIDLIEANCAHLTCREECQFENRNCMFNFFLIHEIQRLKKVRMNIEKKIYYIDTNDPSHHEEIVPLMNCHTIKSYNAVHFIGNDAEVGDENDKIFLRRLLRETKDLEINWLFLHSQESTFEINNVLMPIEYVFDIMKTQATNIKQNRLNITFKYCPIDEFLINTNAKDFITPEYPDIGIYCEFKIDDRNTGQKNNIRYTFYFASKTEKKGGRDIKKYVFVKDDSVTGMVKNFDTVWNNDKTTKTMSFENFLKLQKEP